MNQLAAKDGYENFFSLEVTEERVVEAFEGSDLPHFSQRVPLSSRRRTDGKPFVLDGRALTASFANYTLSA
jgi:hypothetical protein